jgi:hypothetical protein
VASIPAARQRPRNKQLENSRSYVTSPPTNMSSTAVALQRFWEVQVEVTVRLRVSLGVEHPCGTCDQILLPSECCCLKFAVLCLCGTLSDERTGQQLAGQSLNGPSRTERYFTVTSETPPS